MNKAIRSLHTVVATRSGWSLAMPSDALSAHFCEHYSIRSYFFREWKGHSQTEQTWEGRSAPTLSSILRRALRRNGHDASTSLMHMQISRRGKSVRNGIGVDAR